MKKRLLNVFLIVNIAFLTNACFQDVIDINFSESEKQIVIEAVLTDQPEFQYVKVSKVGSYYKNEQPKPVSGAEIEIYSDVDRTVEYIETEPGLYRADNFTGVPGITYNLIVKVEGRTFTANSKMPEAVELDSVKLIAGEYFQNNYHLYKLQCYFKDKLDTENYLWFKQYLNGQLLDNETYLYNDRNTDGKKVIYDDFEDIFILPEDMITLEVMAIDKNTYNYIYSLFGYQSDIDIDLPELFPSNSYNPNTNISNDGLGYFSACTVRRYFIK